MGLLVSEKKIFLVFPIVSLWDLSVAMETTILIQSAPKPNAINPPTQLWFTLNLRLASEIFFFEIVDGRRTDGRRMPAYPISSPVSLWLRSAKLEDHWSCSSPERLSHCKLMRFKLIENRPMKVYAWTLLTPGAWPNLTQGHDWHNL